MLAFEKIENFEHDLEEYLNANYGLGDIPGEILLADLEEGRLRWPALLDITSAVTVNPTFTKNMEESVRKSPQLIFKLSRGGTYFPDLVLFCCRSFRLPLVSQLFEDHHRVPGFGLDNPLWHAARNVRDKHVLKFLLHYPHPSWSTQRAALSNTVSFCSSLTAFLSVAEYCILRSIDFPIAEEDGLPHQWFARPVEGAPVHLSPSDLCVMVRHTFQSWWTASYLLNMDRDKMSNRISNSLWQILDQGDALQCFRETFLYGVKHLGRWSDWMSPYDVGKLPVRVITRSKRPDDAWALLWQLGLFSKERPTQEELNDAIKETNPYQKCRLLGACYRHLWKGHLEVNLIVINGLEPKLMARYVSWCPELHRFFPEQFKEKSMVVLCLRKRLVPVMDKNVWYIILQWLAVLEYDSSA